MWSSTFAQVLYAALDAYAGIVLYKFIIANADPIHFVMPPENDDLEPGTRIRLYTKNSFSFVAQGTVVDALGGSSRRESQMLSSRATRKLKVLLTDVLAPGAIAPYPDESGRRKPLSAGAIGTQVVWDTVRVYLFILTSYVVGAAKLFQMLCMAGLQAGGLVLLAPRRSKFVSLNRK